MADRIAQIAIAADDFDEMIAFYRDHLGGAFIAKFDPPGIAFVRFGDVRLLLEKEGPKSTFYLTVEGIESTFETLKAKGVSFIDTPHLVFQDATGTFGPAGEEEWMVFLKDPSGNLIGLVERKPIPSGD